MLAIQTRYLGPTNFRGSRVVARVMEQPTNYGYFTPARKLSLSWDGALNTDANHRAAARALIARLGWTEANGYGPWIVGDCEPGYVFVCDTKHGSDRMTV